MYRVMPNNGNRGGRPVLSHERFADTLTIRVSTTMREDLKRLAAEQERSLGSVARLAFHAALDQRHEVLTP